MDCVEYSNINITPTPTSTPSTEVSKNGQCGAKGDPKGSKCPKGLYCSSSWWCGDSYGHMNPISSIKYDDKPHHFYGEPTPSKDVRDKKFESLDVL